MLKAFTPVSVLIFSYITGLEKTSMYELYIVTVICIGVAMTSYGEIQFSLIGFTYQLVAIIAESTRLVLTNILLKSLKLDPLSLLYYVSPLCTMFIAISFFIFEYDTFPFNNNEVFNSHFIMLLIFNGFIAFILNIAVVLLISNTSALILTLSGIIKDILLVVLSMAIFQSPVTTLQSVGYTIALIGLNLHKEYKKSPEKVIEILKTMCCCSSSD